MFVMMEMMWSVLDAQTEDLLSPKILVWGARAGRRHSERTRLSCVLRCCYPHLPPTVIVRTRILHTTTSTGTSRACTVLPLRSLHRVLLRTSKLKTNLTKMKIVCAILSALSVSVSVSIASVVLAVCGYCYRTNKLCTNMIVFFLFRPSPQRHRRSASERVL
jgi:hypothetical protein